MKISELKQLLVGVSSSSELVFFQEGVAENEKGEKLMAGIGYFDIENNEFCYLGDIAVLDDDF